MWLGTHTHSSGFGLDDGGFFAEILLLGDGLYVGWLRGLVCDDRGAGILLLNTVNRVVVPTVNLEGRGWGVH